MTADDILDAARSALGTPFVHQGRRAGRAIDCAGLLVHVGKELGLEPIDRAGYPRRPSGGALQAQLDMQESIEKVSGPPQKGDILLMRFSGEPQHLAVYAGPNIIHAYQSVGRVVEHVMDAQWKARIVAIYRFKGLSHE